MLELTCCLFIHLLLLNALIDRQKLVIGIREAVEDCWNNKAVFELIYMLDNYTYHFTVENVKYRFRLNGHSAYRVCVL